MLHGSLERVRPRQLTVDHYQPNSPVDRDREADQQHDSHGQPCLPERVGLSNNPSPDDGVRHIHKRIPHVALWPRVGEMVLGLKGV